MLLSLAVTLGCVQTYAAEVPLTEYDTVSDTGGTDNGGDETAEPSETPAEETWTANPVYNEETGFLTWDEYTGAKDAKFVTYSAIINDGEGDTYTMYLPDRAACLPFYVAKQSQDGEEGEPWTIKGDCEVRVVADPFYEDESTDDNYVITSSDYFCYTFNGGTINPDLPIPVVTEGTLGSPYEQSDGVTAVPVHTVFQEGTYGNIGVLYKLTYNGEEQLDCDYGIYRTCPEGQDHYCCHTDITYGETGEVYVQACSVGIDGSQSEWSEPYLLTAPAEPEEPGPDVSEDTWNANFVYNEETGILSWDDIINSDEEFFYGIYITSSHATGRIHGNSSGAGGWGDSRLEVPNINLPLCLAVLSYDSDFTGEIHVSVKVCPAGNDEFVYYKSADSGVIFTYDGRDVNTELEVPSLRVYGDTVKWNLTEGAIGYLYSKDGEKPFGFNSIPADVNEFTLTDDVSTLSVCSVDKNGDVSEWSELVTVSEEGEWHANFVYNKNTGDLTWDKYIVPETGTLVDKYSLIITCPETHYIFHTVYYNNNVSLPLLLAEYNYKHNGDLKGELDIKVSPVPEEVDGKEIISPDSFSYTFNCKENDPNIAVPKITDVKATLVEGKIDRFNIEILFDAIEGAVGYLFRSSASDYCYSGNYYDWLNGFALYWVTLKDEEADIQMCTVDINGNTSEWSEPFHFTAEQPKKWKANFTYSEETGMLAFDGCKDAEKTAENNIVYTLMFYDEGFFSPIKINVISYRLSDGSFSTPSLSLPGYLTLDLKKGSYEIHAWVNNIDWPSSDQYKYYSEDGFAYEFKGGDVDPKLVAPDVGRAAGVVTKGVINSDWGSSNILRLEYRFDNIPENARALLKELTFDDQSSFVMLDATGNIGSSVKGGLELSREISDSPKISIRVCTVDINGNRSEWSKPVDFELKENKIEEDGYYHFNYVQESVGMSISANPYNNNALGAAYDFNMYIPGVRLGTTTVGELKEICKGIKINDYEFAGCSVPGLTAEDFFTSVVVQTDKDGAMYGGWNDTYNSFTYDFDTDIREKDSEIVRGYLFQIGIKAESVEKAGLKAGDYLVVYLGKPAELNGNTFTYADNHDGITITGGTINNPDVEIPAEIDGRTVTEIGMNAFAFNNNIETLTIPENVKRIDWYAFNTCEKLTEVKLPESLEYIDNWAFERCFSLKTVTVPKNTTHVGSGAFAQNTSMTSVNCDPANGAYISVDGVLFTKDMKELTAYPCGRSGGYTVPESVNHIGNAAFYGAKKLSSVVISGTLDFIGFEAFAECEMLSNVNINDGVNYVGYWAFRGCTGIKQLTVPQSVTNIGDQAFGFRYADNKYDDFSLRGYKDSSVYYYAIRHDIPFVIIGDADSENSPFKEENAVEEPVASDPSKAEEDSIIGITVNPAFNMKNKNETGVGIDLTNIKVKAEEIYQDEESIKRAEEALGDVIKGNKHYNLLDLTLLYNGEDFSNGYDGLVKVIIPIPAGHRDKEFYCYRIVDNNGTPEKELIPGKRVEDSYIIYLEHFSTYAFVGDEDHKHSFGKSYESDAANHWHECSCGEISDEAAHTAGEPIIENDVKYTECTVCGRILSRENVNDTPDNPDNPDNPGNPSNPTTGSDLGLFVLPDTTTESAAETSASSSETSGTSAPTSETTASQTPAENTDIGSDGTTQGGVSDNSTNDSAGGNTGSSDNTVSGIADEDKNQNTGVTLVVIPVLAAAAGIVFSKKRK